jgi:signal transduction histidine kinase
LNALKSTLVAISDDVHQMSRQIHPAILDDLGLEDALRSECNGLEKRHEIAVAFRCGDVPQGIPKDIALCLYRIAQQALWNAAQHAGTDRVEVVLNADPEFVYLEVRDAGRGFDVGALQGKPGLGLVSMKERARIAGGELTVSSEPGKGTTIAVRIPLPEETA